MAKQPTKASFSATCFLLTTLFLHFFRSTAALQVTPNSPCSSFCIDAPDLDKSDPESSNTSPDEITCRDSDFASKPEGQKFQRCLTCLQDSTFSSGHESDQQWFVYNLRYAFDYCILGIDNATEIESSPCITSEACGRIEENLKDSILEPAHAEPYGFCDAGDAAMSSSAVENCLSCVRAGSSQNYLSNFLTAIQAGCEQRPASGITVGLSDTVFTDEAINIVAPISSSSSDGDNATALSTPVIAGIAVGAFVALLLASGCIYMQVRKRRNRAARAAQRSSPLSFRCQTHLTPRTPTFPGEVSDVGEKGFVNPAAALNSNPVGSRWHSPDHLRSNSSGIGITSIVTTPVSQPPAAAMKQYPPSPMMYSPDDNHYTTPTSTTSTTSNAPLIPSVRPYVPAQYAAQAPFPIPGIALSTPEETSSSPYVVPQQQQHRSPNLSTGGTNRSSPRIEQKGWRTAWEQQELTAREGTGGGTRDLVRKKRAVSGSPVTVTAIQTSFPPPPKR